MFTIDKNIPIPQFRSADMTSALMQLEVGDSFLIPCQKDQIKTKQSALQAPIAKCKPKKFTTKQVDGGLRVWRI